MLGNIKFIGELGKLDMLHEGILHRCIQQLLEKKKKKQTVQDMGEDYECLCQILRTVGKRLDHDKARLWMDQYFDRIKTLIGNPELPLRIKFMLLDVLELRSNQWIPRKISMNIGPKTIQQVREEAIREYGMFPNANSAMANLNLNNTDLFGRPLNGTIGPPKSSMGDIFGPMSPPFSGSNSGIGTGPGVLPVDDFTPSFLSGNPGRSNNFNLKPAPYGNRGKQQDGRGGGNSPRFEDRYRNRNNNTPPYQHPEKEADKDDESSSSYSSSNWSGSRDYSGNRYNNRDRDGGSQGYYKNRDQSSYKNQQDGNLSAPKYQSRQRSPYNQGEDDQNPRDNNRSSEDGKWRRDNNRRDEEDSKEQKWEGRSFRNQDGPPQRGGGGNRDWRGDDGSRRDDRDGPRRDDRDGSRRDNREAPRRDDRDLRKDDRDGRRDDRDSRRDDSRRDDPEPRRDERRDDDRPPRREWHADRNNSGERDREPRERDFGSWRDDYRDRDEGRGRQQQGGGRRDWDSYDNKRDQQYNRDNYQRGRDFDSKRDFRNGDGGDSQGDRFDRGRDQDRDFHGGQRDRDFRSNSRGGYSNYREFNRDGGNRDFRDNKSGFRDFGEDRDRGSFDKDRGGFRANQNQQQQQQQPAGGRELPPRFQKKQQQQQSTPPDPLFPTEINSPVPDDLLNPISNQSTPPSIPPGAPPQRFRHPLQQHPPHPGYYPPRYPPPGGPPMRGPPPRGFPGGPPPHMTPRYAMGGGGSPRDQLDGNSPGGPGQSPPQNLPKGPAKVDEISLRPARNFPTMLRPTAPSMLPRSAQNPHSATMQQIPVSQDLLGPGPGGPQPGMKPTNLTIKQIPSSDKDKKDKRKVPNKEELKHSTDELMKSFFEFSNISETVNTIRDMKPPRRFMPEMIAIMIIQGLEKGDGERENISLLIQRMKEEGVLASDLYLDGLCSVLDRMSELEQEIPLVKSNVAKFAAQAVGGDIINLSNLAAPLDNGQHYPFFLLCLQQLHRLKNEQWLTKNFTDSKIDLLRMLPECDRTKERMVEILEDRKLSFMFPLLRVQSDLWRQIRQDANPGNFYKWIKENVDQSLHGDPGFINILVTTILKYITGESTLRSDQDPNNPDKAALDKEKDLVDKYKGVLQRFLLDKVGLQMTAIYSIQVFGYSVDFPKGLMLRMFMFMYDLEIIDEDTFLKWKEEVNDEYPGKGKVLFQVHQWLTWLEQAEEESEEEDN